MQILAGGCLAEELEHGVEGKAPVPWAEERAGRWTGKVQHPTVTKTREINSPDSLIG